MLLIDGHNLIGKMPNVSLSDPDDELKLLRALENYHAMHPHEAMLVVFDPSRDGHGGWSPMRSDMAGIAVRFAPRGSTADAVIARIVREEKRPRGIIVVSSDNAVRKSAQERGAKTMTSEEFVVKLRERYNPRKAKPEPTDPDAAEKPSDSDAEYWSQFFKEPPPAARKSVRPTAKSQSPRVASQPAKPTKGEKPDTAQSDIEYWLRIFSEPAESETKAAEPTHERQTENDIEYWLREFTRKRE